ncbi:fumarylacetoacetate hydrolase family protein [Parenemella sanctibonifatiensis]|uniref:Ureidoglycolate lyase n=1 Tax=Parenemella sanctibonifatiensis TaxID=2016505 RepID=A0A255EPJ7_9ACTN|nr:fumarylacetoacetate hydrolase family protein [Parenemella sanctibonifatiensis]OYN88216.1 ureidoglycolate lyase [Parenemella sanctibonifatiensis]OYN91382.1 ureidoglycolate lyase [Parenemella sanctibonifatiensis]
MKWLTFQDGDTVRHGHLDGDEIVVAGEGDLSEVVRGTTTAPAAGAERRTLAGVRVLAPLLRPGKVLAVAANYQEHVKEAGKQARDQTTATPRLFLKPDTTVTGPDAPVELNPITQQLDWEVEIAVVIGRRAKGVSVEQALDHVFGYATSNDITARSLDLGVERDGEAMTGFFDWLEGKWLDGSAPLGPYLVTADEVADPQRLDLSLTVNGEVMQRGSSTDMVHTVAELVSFSSRLMTLNPGDVILTGTPSGVGATTGRFLKPGDTIVAEVQGLGSLTTPIVAPGQSPAGTSNQPN